MRKKNRIIARGSQLSRKTRCDPDYKNHYPFSIFYQYIPMVYHQKIKEIRRIQRRIEVWELTYTNYFMIGISTVFSQTSYYI